MATSFVLSSSVLIFLEWYPLNPWADIIFENDFIVISLDKLFVVNFVLLGMIFEGRDGLEALEGICEKPIDPPIWLKRFVLEEDEGVC